MVTQKLVPYTFRIYEQRDRGKKIAEDEYYELDSLNMAMPSMTSYSNIVSFLEELFKEISTDPYIDPDFSRTLSAIDWDPEESKGEIEAILNKGNYNDPGDHLDLEKIRNQGKSAEQARDRNALDQETALERRYHFFFKLLDKNPRKGLIILHARGNGGIKTDLKRKIEQNLGSIDDSTTTRFSTVIGGDLYKKLTENPITGFEILETQVDADDYIKDSNDYGKQPDRQRITLNLSAGSDGFYDIDKNKIKKFVKNKEVPIAEFLPDGNDDGTTSHKVEIEKNGKTRKVNISREQPNMEQEITGEIDRTDQGRPDMGSVSKESRRLASEIVDEHDWGSIDPDDTSFQ